MPIKIWIKNAGVINWDFTMTANSGKCEIKLNGSLVVDENNTNSGFFYYDGGVSDYIDVYADAFASKFLNATVSIYITDGSGVIYNQTDDPMSSSASLTTGALYPVGEVYITITSTEY